MQSKTPAIKIDRRWIGAPDTPFSPTAALFTVAVLGFGLGAIAIAAEALPVIPGVLWQALCLYLSFTVLHDAMHGNGPPHPADQRRDGPHLQPHAADAAPGFPRGPPQPPWPHERSEARPRSLRRVRSGVAAPHHVDVRAVGVSLALLSEPTVAGRLEPSRGDRLRATACRVPRLGALRGPDVRSGHRLARARGGCGAVADLRLRLPAALSAHAAGALLRHANPSRTHRQRADARAELPPDPSPVDHGALVPLSGGVSRDRAAATRAAVCNRLAEPRRRARARLRPARSPPEFR